MLYQYRASYLSMIKIFKTSAKCRRLGGLFFKRRKFRTYSMSKSLLIFSFAFVCFYTMAAERGRLTYTLVRFENCVTEELLMRKNYISSHSRDHADSECVSYVGVNSKETEFYR